MANNLGYRTREAFEQLTRYADQPFNEQMVGLLEALVELNDDLYHDRAKHLISTDLSILTEALESLRVSVEGEA